MKRWIVFVFVFALVGAALVYCERRKTDSPVGPQAFVYFVADTEREMTRLPVSFTRLSDADEIRIGDELTREYRPRLGAAGKTAEAGIIEPYVQRVGARVASGAHRKLPYRFHYIPDPNFINAFALPGGHVFIGKGLMSLMDSEDELAAVLGHEVEHIDHYHCAERVQTEAALRKLPLGELWGIPVEVFEAGYSKDQELEADREGAMLAAREGYSLQGALAMFETFDLLDREHVQRARSPQAEVSQVTIQALQDYFRSHPATRERIAQIRDLIASNPNAASTKLQEFKVAFVFDTDKADRALAAGQYPTAAALIAKVLAQNPKYVAALKVQAESAFALHNFQAAVEAYRTLLELDPASGQLVVEYADKLASAALDKGDPRLAADFASHVLELQVNEPQALKLLAAAQIESGNSSDARARYLQLKSLYPTQAEALLHGLDVAAESAYARGIFQQAVRLSEGALALEPSHRSAFVNLGDAQFALANFPQAARSYRAVIEATLQAKEPLVASLVTRYADALGSGPEARAGWVNFKQLMDRFRLQSPEMATQSEVELAGLMLVAGDDSGAKELATRAHAQTALAIAPEALARLGWWYYRAQNPSGAQVFLAELARMRPADLELRNFQGWAALDLQSPSVALDIFQQVPFDVEADAALGNGPRMGRAIALWRGGKRDAALVDFQVLAGQMSQWTDPQWVASIYSQGAARTVGEMAKEYQNRQSARRQR